MPTYRNPTKNTTSKPFFLGRLNVNPAMMGKGMMKRARSATTAQTLTVCLSACSPYKQLTARGFPPPPLLPLGAYQDSCFARL